METEKLNVLFFPSHGLWVGQCLQYDIAVQGESLPETLSAMEAVLLDRVRAAADGEISAPFDGIPEAPAKFWDLFEHAIPIIPASADFSLPADVPPAFVIQQRHLELRVY